MQVPSGVAILTPSGIPVRSAMTMMPCHRPGSEAACSSSGAPAQPQYEFMGPWLGPLGIMAGLPAVCYALVYTCNAGGCSLLSSPAQWPGFPPGSQVFSGTACMVYIGWVLAQVTGLLAPIHGTTFTDIVLLQCVGPCLHTLTGTRRRCCTCCSLG